MKRCANHPHIVSLKEARYNVCYPKKNGDLVVREKEREKERETKRNKSMHLYCCQSSCPYSGRDDLLVCPVGLALVRLQQE